MAVLCVPLISWSDVDQDKLKQCVIRAYNFDAVAFDELKQKSLYVTEPHMDFLMASSLFWTYQADRTNEDKRQSTLDSLSQSIKSAKHFYKQNKKDPVARFYLGIGYCNRSRYYVEEKKWVKSYLDAREGMGILEDLLEDHPDYYDAMFALGVAECFLSDAPVMLKPLARLLGFKGSAEHGIRKLEDCVANGEWTAVEAEYYLAYYYYNVSKDGEKAAAGFKSLVERFPRNPMFGYFLGRSYQIAHKPLDALEAYRNIRDICYEVGAYDIGHWTTYRIGNILHGEHLCEEAIEEYNKLKLQLKPIHQDQEYFYRLPLKFAKSFHEMGDDEKALVYLNLIKSNWDGDTYKKARKLKKEIES